ncbi:MAG: hypothetical protein II683_02180 [Muribaculaceae bacterium]|nr:hypothetical protein [Muribaculaceae bacterium]
MKQLLIEESMPTLNSPLLSDFKQQVEQTEGMMPHPPVDADRAQWQQCLCWYVNYLMTHNRSDEAATLIDAWVNDDSLLDFPNIMHAWIWLVRMTIYIAHADRSAALSAAENALRVLVEVTNKRHADFLAILASLLYNLAIIHHENGDNNRAVKELTKAQKIFERLVKRNERRFTPMMLYSIEASTTIYKSRAKQMSVFEHYQTNTQLYTAMLSEGGTKARTALNNLVESLKKEGDLMLIMGNARNAAKFYTKALRYQKKASRTMGHKELVLSIGLAKALIRLANRRDAAEQLLNSLLPLAQRINATDEIAEIEQLLNNKNKNINIMTLLKGLS